MSSGRFEGARGRVSTGGVNIYSSKNETNNELSRSGRMYYTKTGTEHRFVDSVAVCQRQGGKFSEMFTHYTKGFVLNYGSIISDRKIPIGCNRELTNEMFTVLDENGKCSGHVFRTLVEHTGLL